MKPQSLVWNLGCRGWFDGMSHTQAWIPSSIPTRRTIRGRFYLLFLVLNAYIISTNDLKTRVVTCQRRATLPSRVRVPVSGRLIALLLSLQVKSSSDRSFAHRPQFIFPVALLLSFNWPNIPCSKWAVCSNFCLLTDLPYMLQALNSINSLLIQWLS